ASTPIGYTQILADPLRRSISRILFPSVADPRLEAVGDGEVEATLEPHSLDEDWFARRGVNLELHACVPRPRRRSIHSSPPSPSSSS
ncbi:unnamed protein product, partial [Linum tenue]